MNNIIRYIIVNVYNNSKSIECRNIIIYIYIYTLTYNIIHVEP